MTLAGAYSLDYLLAHYTPYATLLISWAEAFYHRHGDHRDGGVSPGLAGNLR